MSFFLPLRPSRALALCSALSLSLGLSLALPNEVRAQGLNSVEVWASWQEAVEATGGRLSAEEKREGMRLTLSDITLYPSANPLPRIRFEELILMGQADGSVALQLPEQQTLRLELPQTTAPSADKPLTDSEAINDIATDDPAVLSFTLNTPQLGFAILGLGLKPEVMFSAPEVTLTLDNITPALPDGNEMNFELALQNLGLRYKHDLASDTPSFDTAWQLDQAALRFEGNNAGTLFSHKWQFSDLKAEILAKFPPSSQEIVKAPGLTGRLFGPNTTAKLQALALLRALNDGLVIDLNATMGAVEIALNGLQEQEDPTQSHAGLTLQSAAAHLKLNKEGFDSALSLLTPDLKTIAPFAQEASDEPQVRQLAFSAQELAGKLSFGLADLRRPQNWALGLNLREVQGDETAWTAFDPTKTLPRDPISLILDTKGSFLTNRAALAAPSLLPPPANRALDTPALDESALFERFEIAFNALEAKGLGVDFSGTGGVMVDFNKPPALYEMPMPAGKLSFAFSGVAKLIEHLTAMGLLSSTQAIQARLSLPMIAKATEAADSFTSELDFRDESLYLNGKKIR